jgi:hypothetical protein
MDSLVVKGLREVTNKTSVEDGKRGFFGNGSHFKAVLKQFLESIKSSFKEKMEKLCKHYVFFCFKII